MGGKSGGGARTPTIERNTLHSAQKLKFIDLISSGEIFGFKHGNDQPLKSILLNGTPIQNQDDSLNFNGVRVEWNRGTNDQDYLPSFSTIDRAVPVGAQVKKNTPITRTVSNSEVTSIRVTAGVDALMRTTKEGDQLKAEVSMTIMLMKNNVIHSSKLMTLNEKGSKPFRLDFEFDDLPEVPFEIRCVRNTADSNDDMLRNNTYFFSYVESIDAKMSYPLSAVAAMEIDSEQFGNDNPERTYDLKGAIVQVPSNYDPETRTYHGLWDRLFKPAWTNNPAWILYDLLIDEIDGFNALNKGIKIDIDSFYNVAKYCDELIDDGSGGKEPRFVCNAVFYGEDAYTAINNICSSFRAVCGYNGEYLTLYTDRAHDVAKIYNNSMVVDGLFEYSETELSQRYNQVQVQYVDENNGYETTIDEVSDDANIALVERILTLSIVAFGATKLSYARRAALWALITSLTEKVLVSFKVGASGIYHEIYDIIEIVDNDYMGVMVGGRIKAIDGNIITLDREVNDVVKFSIETKSGPQNFDVKRQISETEYELDLAPDIIESAPYNAILPNVEPRLFRCTNIEENNDGTYTVSAIQHNPQKEAIVDNGAQYMPEGNTTIINSVPGLSNGIANNDGRAIILEWDSLSVIGTENKYRIQLFRDKAIYQTFETKETFLRLENLPQGEYIAKIRAVNSNGQYSEEITIAFSTTYKIDGLRAKPIVFGIELNWQLPALITSDAFTEIWYSEKDDRMTATKLATVVYPQNNYLMNGLSVSDKFYFWFRLVDVAGNQGEFSHSILGKPSGNADDILGYLDGKISDKQISKDLQDQFDKNIDDKIKPVADKVDEVVKDIEAIDVEFEGIHGDLTQVQLDAQKALEDAFANKTELEKQAEIMKLIEKTQGDSAAQQKLLELVNATNDKALYARSYLLEAKTGQNTAKIEQVETVMTTKTDSLAERLDTVYTSVDNNSSKITALDKTMTSEFASQALQIKNLEAGVEDNKANISRVDTAVVDLEKAQAKTNTELNTKIEESESYLKLWALTESTNNKSLAQNYFLLSAQHANSAAKIEQIQQAVANNELAITTVETRLNARIESNVAEIKRVDDARVTFEKSQAFTNTQLTTDLKDAKASISQNAGAISELDKAQAVTNQNLEAGFKESSAQQKLQSLVESTNDKSLAARVALTTAQTGQNTAKVEGLDTALTTEQEARAEAVRRLEAEAGANKASIEEVRSTTATVEGNVNSMWTMKLNANGASTGFMLGTDGEEGLFKVAADTFIISTSNQDVNMFTIQNVNGKFVAALNGDLIAKGTISAEALVADSFKGYKIDGVEINAGKFTGGSITIGGTAINPNFKVDENGNLYAKSGRFEGTVYADKIEGDVVSYIRINQHTSTIGASYNFLIEKEPFDRTIQFLPFSAASWLRMNDRRTVDAKPTIEILLNNKVVQRVTDEYQTIWVRDSNLTTSNYEAGIWRTFRNSDHQLLVDGFHDRMGVSTGEFSVDIPANTDALFTIKFYSNVTSTTDSFVVSEIPATIYRKSRLKVVYPTS